MNTHVAQCRYHLSLANSLLVGLDDAHRALQPYPGAKTGGWLIGHLAVTGDFGRRLCGAPPLCPREWRARFNPGSRPSMHAADYPPMHALVDLFREVYADLCTVAPVADPAMLGAPNPYEPARPDFPTAGDFVAYLMSGHLAYHVGQLVAWCTAAGLRQEGASGWSAAPGPA